MFVKLKGKEAFIPISRIEEIEQEKEGSWTIYRSKTDFVVAYSESAYSIMRKSAPVVPALPDFEVLIWHKGRDGKSDYYSRSPIIAWRIDGDEAIPITDNWSANDYFKRSLLGEAAILRPNETRLDPGASYSICNNLEEWIAEMRSRHDAKTEAEE